MTLLPLAAAAGGGSIDGIGAPQLVAAGFTLLQRSPPLVRALAGRRAAILLPPSAQFLTALAASDGRGAVLVNPLAAPAEIAYQLGDANVGAVFTSRALAARLPAGTPHVLLDDAPYTARMVAPDGTTDVDLGSHFGLDLAVFADEPGRDEECAIVYTSAMAGTPLGAILTHRNLVANARQTVEAAQLTPRDHCLAVLPFAHLFGLTATAMAPLFVGARATTMPRFNPLAAVELLREGGVSYLVGVPTVFAGLLAAIDRRGGRLESEALRLCICGGAPIAVALQDRWFEATGVELRQGYGLTECAPVALFNRVDAANRRGTLGLPMPGCEVSVRDPATNAELPDGTPGQICIRGETVFRGYVRGGEHGLVVRDGWLGSGDLGVRNADGTISFVGVIKEMFTRSGFNVYPREIERAVAQLPGVRSVRAYSSPGPTRENDVGVDVTGTVNEAEVRAWCELRLSVYKQPSVITVTTR